MRRDEVTPYHQGPLLLLLLLIRHRPNHPAENTHTRPPLLCAVVFVLSGWKEGAKGGPSRPNACVYSSRIDFSSLVFVFVVCVLCVRFVIIFFRSTRRLLTEFECKTHFAVPTLFIFASLTNTRLIGCILPAFLHCMLGSKSAWNYVTNTRILLYDCSVRVPNGFQVCM